MVAVSAKMEASKQGAKRVGKKRSVSTDKPKTLKERFAANLRQLAGDHTAVEIATHLGVTPDAVLKWLRGRNMPDLELWPDLAKYFGLKDYRDLLPPR